MAYTIVPDLFAEIAIPESGKATRIVFEDESLKVLLFAFAPGFELVAHSTPYPATIAFLEGEASVGLGDERVDVSGGAWLYMEPKLVHSVTAKSGVRMLLSLHKAAKATE
jgi:quercetin dioxygenase-like cupin family protein